MGNELSTLTTDDLQVQLEQLQKTEAEEKARELLKQETSYDISYEKIIEKGGTGFMEAYVQDSADYYKKYFRARLYNEMVFNVV